jgi:hypothetical protein
MTTEQNNGSNTQTQNQNIQKLKLAPDEELRFEVEWKNTVTLTVALFV